MKQHQQQPAALCGRISDNENGFERRYPRLLKALSRQCLLTPLEALSVLRRCEPEAVRHLGGWQKAVQAAWHSRHR